MRYDLDIEGNGFYRIHGRTKKGGSWICDNVPLASEAHRDMVGNWHAHSDDTRLTSELANGAFEDGLRVRINGKRYIGDGKVAA